MPWSRALRAAIAALGAYFLVAAVALVPLLQLQYVVPLVGTIAYPQLLPVLAAVTAIGASVAAFVSQRYGGVRATAIVVALWAIAAVCSIAPYVRAGPRAWVPPSDISGLMTAVVLTVSWAVALPAFVAGALAAARLAPRAQPPNALLAAGAYYAAALGLSLPTPQLDARVALPFTAGAYPDVVHAALLTPPAIAAGLVLAAGPRSPVRVAVIAALLGLAGAAPFEIPILWFPPRPYWPVSIVAVPVFTAGLAVLAASARRAIDASRSARVQPNTTTAALAGAAAALVVVGAWTSIAGLHGGGDYAVRIDAYYRTGDERKIVACVTSGRGIEVETPSVREETSRVTVTIWLRRPPTWEFSDLVGIPLPVVVSLDAPLGDRAVIDGASGSPAPEAIRDVNPRLSC